MDKTPTWWKKQFLFNLNFFVCNLEKKFIKAEQKGAFMEFRVDG